MASSLDIVGINKRFGKGDKSVEVLRKIDIHVAPGEFLILVGPSGCGKSTLLKAVGGFIAPVEGEIRLDGQVVSEPGPDRIVVFQEFDQLPPWKTVRQNVMFPLLASRTLKKKEAEERALHYLEKVGLAAFVEPMTDPALGSPDAFG